MTFDLLEEVEQPFNDEIKRINQQLKISELEFLQSDFAYNRNEILFPIQLYEISKVYSELAFSNSEKIILKFRELGIPLPKLKWIIPLENILNVFSNIENNGEILLIKKNIIHFIHLHLKSKIRNEIFLWGNQIVKSKMKFDLKHYYKLIFRRIKDGNGRLRTYKNEIERQIENEILEMRSLFPDWDQFSECFLSIIAGKTEYNYLKDILQSCYYEHRNISKRQFFCKIYDLFRLICKDEDLLSEAEFNDRTEMKINQKSEKTYYDGDYEDYKYKKLRKLIYKK